MSFDDNVLIHGPSFHIELAPEDARHPVMYSRRLLLFRCESAAQRDEQVAALKTGLHGLLSRCPFLGGTTAGKEDWRTIVPGEGLELVVRDLSTVMPSFQELEADNFPVQQLPYDPLVPTIPQDLRPFAACKMQFSAITGGTILTFAASHSVADGSGMNELMRILADETASKATSAHAVVGIDRTFLRTITSEIPFDVSEHPAYISSVPNAAPDPNHHHPFAATSPEIPVLLCISASKLAQLKADATPGDGSRISTHDALSAFIWRSVILIRSRRTPQGVDIPPSTMSHLFMPSDARRHLGLPPTYIGNAVYQLTAALELGTLLSPGPSGLQAAARAIRQAIMALKPELVASYFAELKERWVTWGFLGGNGVATTNVAMGSGFSGEVYGGAGEWGEVFGELVRFRNPGEVRGGSWVLPKRRDGSAEVVVEVMSGEVEVLRGDECFGRYLG